MLVTPDVMMMVAVVGWSSDKFWIIYAFMESEKD